MMPMDEFELKLLRGQIPGLPSEDYEAHHDAVEYCLAIGIEPRHVSHLLSGAILRTDDEIVAFDASEAGVCMSLDERPTCPTCGGTGLLPEHIEEPWTGNRVPCPENDGHCDGRVTVGRMAKVWEAVHVPDWQSKIPGTSAAAAVAYLRAIR